MTSAFPAVRSEPRPELLAPGSAAHRVLSEPFLYGYVLPAFLLPLFHPATAAAAMAMDTVFTDADADLFDYGRRLRDTVEMIAGVAHAGDEADHVAFAMRELHRGVSGQDAHGERYHAWTREIWTWNWAAILSSVMTTYGNLRGYRDDAFREDTYLGLVELGRRFGVIGLPSSYADFAATWPGERDRVAVPDNATVRRVHALIHSDGLPRPRILRRLPGPVWKPLSSPVRHVLRVSIILGLDDGERVLLGFEDRRLDALTVRLHRAFWRLALPPALAYPMGRSIIQARARWGTPVWRTRFSAAALSGRGR